MKLLSQGINKFLNYFAIKTNLFSAFVLTKIIKI